MKGTLLTTGLALVLAVVLMGQFGAGRLGSSPARAGDSPRTTAIPEVDADGPWRSFEKPAPEALRDRLTVLQYRVTQEDGTEPAFRNDYWDHKAAGIYVDVVSGEPLFSSRDKYASGSGWPAFTRPLVPEHVVEHDDVSLGVIRTEVRSRYGDSHLGHVFADGPPPTGLRYCVNSAALRFVPADRLAGEGYGAFAVDFPGSGKEAAMPARTETATLAGGCFWGMEDIIRDIPGVIETRVGYTGGTVENATYGDVKTGASGHAESVRVVFDPGVLSYEDLLLWFFRMHDPTTVNRQGNDRGTQYRSAIFYHDETQRGTAERVKAEVDAAGHYDGPIVTEIVPASQWYDAEAYHQDYLEKNPGGYTCHFLRDWDVKAEN